MNSFKIFDNSNIVNSEVEITALSFRVGSGEHQLEEFPRRMVWGEREYNFIDQGMQYLVRKGQELVRLFDVSDGQQDFRLRLENDHWTLIDAKAVA
jgi:hypothetical protein